MTPLKYLLASLLAGIIIGASAFYFYEKSSANEKQNADNELVDFIIGEWTETSPDELLPLRQKEGGQVAPSERGIDGAQFHSNTTYRLGHIPDSIRSLAMMVEEKYRVPHAVTLAQFILESRWGKNMLGVNNPFGHTFAATGKFSELKKSVARTESIGLKKTLRFTVYKDIAEAFNCHGKYLSSSSHYRAAFYTSTPENFARAIGSVYAEDDEYAMKLISIMRRYKL